MSVNIVVPEVGESIVDARVAKWLRKEGESVAAGDALVELETDKIDLEVSAPRAGVLKRIDRKDGDDVKVGEVLGVIEEGAPAQGAKGAESAQSAEGDGGQPSRQGADRAREGAPKTRATPTARKAAEQSEVDLARIKGSGDAGRVMRRDVEQASRSGQPASAEATAARPAETGEAPLPAAISRQHEQPSAFAKAPADKSAPRAPSPPPAPPVIARPTGARTEERVRMSKRRATIAKRLVEAQSTAAMLTTFNEVDMSGVVQLRERHKQAFKERHGFNLGMTSFFVKAAIAALRAFPRINAEIQGDEMVIKHYYDIGIAVGASEGLVVPVLRDADLMSFPEIEARIRDFAKRAEDGTLSLADLKGGTFTITNGGVFGSLQSTPILNPPQVGILGLHAIKERPVGVNGQIVLRPMMYTALTYDHRIVDGSEAVRFLVRVKEFVEDPGALLLE